MQEAILYDILEDEGVTLKIVEFENKNQAFDNLWLGLTWKLARDPFCGLKIKDGIYFIKTETCMNMQLRLIYEIRNSHSIEIKHIDICIH